MAFMDDLHGIFLVFGFSGEGKGIFLLAIGDLVDPEPFIGGSDKARQMSFDILDVIQLGCKGILNINNYDLPVGFSFIEKSHDTEDLDLLDLADVANLFADFTNIKGVIIALGLCLSVHVSGIFPSLGESTVVPDVPMVGEAVPDVAQSTLLYVLLDRIEGFFLGNFHLGVGPAGNLDYHVEDTLVLIGKERDVVEWRDD